MEPMVRSFALAPMSPAIRVFTLALIGLPLAGSLIAVLLDSPLVPAVLVGCGALGLIYAMVWLWSRPRSFEIGLRGLVLRWPVRSRELRWEEITGVRAIDRRGFRTEFGWPVRVGVGGLWGGFGWLWTRRRGWLHFYVSRTDGLVLIETRRLPWLITPTEPGRFIEAARAGGPSEVSKV